MQTLFDAFLRMIIQTILGALTPTFTMFAEGQLNVFLFPIVGSLIKLFYNFGFCLWVVGSVVAVFQNAIAAEQGGGSMKNMMFNIGKGYIAVSLFTILPPIMFTFAIQMQVRALNEITTAVGLPTAKNIEAAGNLFIDTFKSFKPGIFTLLIGIASVYAIVKVFLDYLKRGGILVIYIIVGSLHMFSIPRGYTDAFFAWCKEVCGLCLMTFLQTVLLFIGVILVTQHPLAGMSLLFSAAMAPSIARSFGVDTSAKANIQGAVSGAMSAVSTIAVLV